VPERSTTEDRAQNSSEQRKPTVMAQKRTQRGRAFKHEFSWCYSAGVNGTPQLLAEETLRPPHAARALPHSYIKVHGVVSVLSVFAFAVQEKCRDDATGHEH
jgi:hypothetical protein